MTVDFTSPPWSCVPRNILVEIVENAHRKELTELEKAGEQRKLKQILEACSEQGRRTDLEQNSKGSRSRRRSHGVYDHLKDVYCESHFTISKRIRVLEEIEKNPELHKSTMARLKASKPISISKAYDEVVRKVRKQEILQTAPAVQFPEDISIWQGDFVNEKCRIPANSVDLIFTDPPYDRDSLVLYEELAKLSPLLKDGGCLAVYAANYYLPEIMGIFEKEKSLTYLWTLSPAVKQAKKSPEYAAALAGSFCCIID